jgi:hypothetical protein
LNIVNLIREGRELFDWTEWTSRYGWCDVERVRDERAVSDYVRKYVTKTLAEQKRGKGERLFYSSHGLARHEQVLQTVVSSLPVDMREKNFWDYSDEYCQVKKMKCCDESVRYIEKLVQSLNNKTT